MRKRGAVRAAGDVTGLCGKLEMRIDGFLDKIADPDSATAVTAYERRIEKLETASKPRGPAETLEPALLFFSNPWKISASGCSELRKLVLRLAFAERPAYCRKTGPRIPKTTLHFNVLGGDLEGRLGFGGPEETTLVVYHTHIYVI